jgi:hypothetical protein
LSKLGFSNLSNLDSRCPIRTSWPDQAWRLEAEIRPFFKKLRVRGLPRALALARLTEGFAAPAREGGTGCQSGRTGQPGLLRDGVVGNSLARQQNYLALARHPLRVGACTSPALQLVVFELHRSSEPRRE